MAYDENLAERVRAELSDLDDVNEIKMFGGLCFTLKGNMCLGVVKEDLMVRFAPALTAKALAKPGAREMDFGPRTMEGFVFVDPAGVKTAAALRGWVKLSLDYVGPMPPKKPKKKKAAKGKTIR